MQIQDELKLDWACRLADDDIATGYHTNWDAAYESALNFIEDETLCHDEYRSMY